MPYLADFEFLKHIRSFRVLFGLKFGFVGVDNCFLIIKFIANVIFDFSQFTSQAFNFANLQFQIYFSFQLILDFYLKSVSSMLNFAFTNFS